MRASHDGVGVHGRMEIAAGVAGGSGHRGGNRLDDRTGHLRASWIVEEDRGAAQGWKLTSNPLDRKSCHVGPLARVVTRCVMPACARSRHPPRGGHATAFFRGPLRRLANAMAMTGLAV